MLVEGDELDSTRLALRDRVGLLFDEYIIILHSQLDTLTQTGYIHTLVGTIYFRKLEKY